MLKHLGDAARLGASSHQRARVAGASFRNEKCLLVYSAGIFYYYFDYFERAMMKVATDMRALARLIQIEVLAEMKALRASILRGST